jgi:hypothetical protein
MFKAPSNMDWWGWWERWRAGKEPAPVIDDLPFSHLVPLGLSCRVTHQVRRFSDIGIAYPFDWWLSPLSGLARYLADPDPERIYSPSRLEEVLEDGRIKAIRSIEFGIELFHEFPRLRIPVNGAEVSVVAPDWEAHIGAAREKHSVRLQRLLATNQSGNRILFVRHRYDADRQGPAPAADIRALHSALQAKWSKTQIVLMLVNVPSDGPLPTGVRSVSIEDVPGPSGHEWQGSSAPWQAAFETQRIRLRAGADVDSPAQWCNQPPD